MQYLRTEGGRDEEEYGYEEDEDGYIDLNQLPPEQ